MANFCLAMSPDHFSEKINEIGRSFLIFSLKLLAKTELRRYICCSIAEMDSTTGIVAVELELRFRSQYFIYVKEGFFTALIDSIFCGSGFCT